MQRVDCRGQSSPSHPLPNAASPFLHNELVDGFHMQMRIIVDPEIVKQNFEVCSTCSKPDLRLCPRRLRAWSNTLLAYLRGREASVDLTRFLEKTV